MRGWFAFGGEGDTTSTTLSFIGGAEEECSYGRIEVVALSSESQELTFCLRVDTRTDEIEIVSFDSNTHQNAN